MSMPKTFENDSNTAFCNSKDDNVISCTVPLIAKQGPGKIRLGDN